MNDLEKIQSNDLITKETLTETDIDVLRKSKFKGFSDAEMNYAKSICHHLQLNPLLNQLHFVKRRMKNEFDQYIEIVSLQIGIDGFRLLANRAGGYAGSDDTVFEYEENDTAKKIPKKASVTIYRIVQGIRCSFTASARWSEYLPNEKNRMMWNKMPHTMLGKCAEALALRKGFPAELSALRSEEEMDQAEESESKADKFNKRDVVNAEVVNDKKEDFPPPVDDKLISEAQRKRMYAIQKENNIPVEMTKSILSDLGFKSSKDVTKDKYELICNMIEKIGKENRERDLIAMEEQKKKKEEEERLNKERADKLKINVNKDKPKFKVGEGDIVNSAPGAGLTTDDIPW